MKNIIFCQWSVTTKFNISIFLIQKISVDETYNDIQCIMKFGGKKNRKILVNGVIWWIETACSDS